MLAKWLVYLSRVSLSVAVVVIFILSVIKIDQSLPGDLSDKFYHGLAFFVLSFLASFSFFESGFTAHLYLPLFLYGVLIEVTQYFLPYRSFSIADMLADTAGIFIYYLIFRVLLNYGFFSFAVKKSE